MKDYGDTLYDPRSWEQRVGGAVYSVSEWTRRNMSPKKLLRRVFHPIAWGAAYAVMGLWTFGHVAAANYRIDAQEYAKCAHVRAVKVKLESSGGNSGAYDNYCEPPEKIPAAGYGVAAGVFWPLWLIWEAQQ